MFESIFDEGTIYEVLLTTCSARRVVNVSPVGVTRRGSVLELSIESATTTATNLRDTACATINVLQNPLVFAQATFNQLPSDEIAHPKGFEAPALIKADAWIATRVSSATEVSKADRLGPTSFLHVILKPLAILTPGPPRPHSRQFAAIIEALIHASRALVAASRGIPEQVETHIQLSRDHLKAAKQLGDDPSVIEAIRLCESRLEMAIESVRLEED